MSATRALARLARRDVARSPWRSLLIGLLILLPVAGMAWGISILATVIPSAEARDTHFMGAADLMVGSAPSTDRVRALFPLGTQLEPMTNGGGRLLLPGTSANLSLMSRDLDGLARGTFTIIQGRQPNGPREVAISAEVARIAGVSIGGSVELEGLGTFAVVGTVEDPWDLRGRLVLQDKSVANAAEAANTHTATWLVKLPAGTDPVPIVQAATDPMQTDEPFQIEWRLASGRMAELGGTAGTDGPPTPAVVVLGGLVLLESALVAAAAFAVSIRRRQRELGLLAAAGAEPGHLAKAVLAEGVVLGVLGSIGGIAVGLLAAAATWPFLDGIANRRNPPLVIEPVALCAAALIGFVAALVAAAVPAWSASRLPVLVALSGRRPPSSPARRFLQLGIAVIVLAAVMTTTGATLSLASDNTTVPLLLLAGGAMLGTLGFGAVSPWLLERLEGLSARMPVSGRVALRDTARARSRSAPIVTAILASLAATIALGAYGASRDAEIAAHYQRWMAPDQLIIEGPDAGVAGPQAATAVHAVAAAVILGSMTEDEIGYAYISAPAAHLADPNDRPRGTSPDWGKGYTSYNLSIADDQVLRALHAEEAAADLAAGSIVLLTQRRYVDLDTVTIIKNDGYEDDAGVAVPARTVLTGVGGGNLPEALISEAAAARLGIVAPPTVYRFVLRLDHAVTDEDLKAAATASAAFPDTRADADMGPRNPDDAFRLFLIILSLLFSLTVTGVAVSLGEAESRPDQRTLLALGAEPRLRRRITAARAGVLAILAGCLAVPAGLLPVWGLLESRGAHLVIPAPEIAAAVGILPVLAIVATWLFARPIPDWSAFRSMTT